MTPLYNLGIRLYRLGIAVASWRNPKAEKLRQGQRETFARLREKLGEKRGGERRIWIHAASLGEFEQGRPIIEHIRREHPEMRVVLTFFSPSGYEIRKNYDGADVVAYLPMDTPKNVRRFLDLAQPDMAIFVKYEFWGNYLEQLKERGVPTYLVSAIFREGQIFFRPYGAEFRKMLKCFTGLYVQDEASQERLKRIGVGAVEVTGDTRFDRVTAVRAGARRIPAIEAALEGVKHVVVAGSTWSPDEELLATWLAKRPDVKAVVAPHEFDATRLGEMKKQFGADDTCFLSELNEDNAKRARVIIVDSFGLLSSLYRYASVAYVGGGFGAGIHNINEAAVYGVPVIYGPRHGKFKEAKDLASCGGGFPLKSGADFEGVMERLTKEDGRERDAAAKASKEYIGRMTGATSRFCRSVGL